MATPTSRPTGAATSTMCRASARLYATELPRGDRLSSMGRCTHSSQETERTNAVLGVISRSVVLAGRLEAEPHRLEASGTVEDRRSARQERAELKRGAHSPAPRI